MKDVQLSKRDSKKYLKELLRNAKGFRRKIIPGNVILTRYVAKYDEPYDARPLFLVLAKNSHHVLGLNFHWLPVNMRMKLVYVILKLNSRNIREGKPLVFSYKQLKPFLRRFNYAPCVRLYIKDRYAPKGVVVPPEDLVKVARLDTAIFTGISAEKAYALAKAKYYKKRKRI